MKNTVQTLASIVSDSARGMSRLLCCTGDLYYPQLWEYWGVQAEEKKDERARSNQRTS